jgi:hypothetical protein
MAAGGDRAHDPPAGLARQTGIQRRADQLIAEQRYLLRPSSSGNDVVVITNRHV